MTPTAFKTKWAKFTGKESAAYQEHFNDLCNMLGVKTPVEADPTGSKFFCFQKHVAKDAELFDFDASGDASPSSRENGFADVWKADCFGMEYKGPGENLEKAYKQLLRYREALLNPPLLIVCDFVRYVVRTNFNGAVQETHEFTNDTIDSPEALRVLRAAFTNPEELRPRETTADVTERLARQIADIALSLQKREAVELENAKTRRQHYVGQKKNLRIARFLNRLVFCFFAEDTELLPKGIFADVCALGKEDPQHFAESLEDLFKCMAKGGRFGTHKIRHFNGHLFEDATVFELTPDEIAQLADAAAANWQNIRPAIMGTLFERALDEGQRSQLGAHYTSEEDITTLVEPVLMAPLRREWTALRRDLAKAIVKNKGSTADRDRLAAFQAKIASVVVLDPACGSGNFLYVALQLLLGLEKDVIAIAAQLGFTFTPQVTVQQLRAIELNAYAYELAQVSVQIGYLQWRRDNGFENERTPVLQNLEGFENKDALLNETFRKKPKNLKEAQAEEHGLQDELFKVYTERAWPECDVIVGNPPFLGGSRLWEELGRSYQKELLSVFNGRLPGFADLCCYWFEKARQQIEDGKCKRAGLLATQGIRGGANREVLNRVKKTGNIFFAESDRPWILAGAAVNISMIGFDNGADENRILDGVAVQDINANLTSIADTTKAKTLAANQGICFIGTKKAGEFEVADETARSWLDLPNPHGKPNSDVLRSWVNGDALIKARRSWWIIDAGPNLSLETMVGYEKPFEWIAEKVKPDRDRNNEVRTKANYWIHKRPGPDMRKAVFPLLRCLSVVRHAKHLIFRWLSPAVLPDDGIYVFANDSDLFFGTMQSTIHRAWALCQGTQLEDRPRYTPTTCFETFPFPRATAEQETAVATAAKDLNELRERWLNPPEWTETRILEFPGSQDGPWARYIDKATVNEATGIGTVRYPRLEPRDADCAAKLAKRTLTNLYNERPAWLDHAHRKLDAAVFAAYGWQDLATALEDARCGTLHDFKSGELVQLEATSEGLKRGLEQVTKAVDELILERLLALNLQRAAEEAKAAATTAKPKAQRAKQASEML